MNENCNKPKRAGTSAQFLELAKSLIGSKFGRATILEIYKKIRPKNGTYWYFARAVCECGKEFDARVSHLKCGQVSSCGCYGKEVRKNNLAKRKQIYESAMEALQRSVYRKYQKLHTGNITFDQFIELSQQRCSYCNALPANENKISLGRTEGIVFIYNGLDRVDNSKPHDYENCVPCCRHCNIAKADYSKEEFLTLVSNIYNFSILK